MLPHGRAAQLIPYQMLRPSITTTQLRRDACRWAVPFVNAHRPTVATVLALRSFPKAARQAVVVILMVGSSLLRWACTYRIANFSLGSSDLGTWPRSPAKSTRASGPTDWRLSRLAEEVAPVSASGSWGRPDIDCHGCPRGRQGRSRRL